MNTEILYFAGDVILLTTFPALALFVGFYYFGSPWKRLLVGRSLMYFAMSLLAIVIAVSLSLWLGHDYFGREWVRIICYTFVSFTTWRLFFTLRRIQTSPPPEADQIGMTNLSDEEILELAEEIRAERKSSLEKDSPE